jgi:hypothetical protein
MRSVNPHVRLVALGCSTVVIGVSLATLGVVSTSGDWIMAGLGGVVGALGLLLVVTAVIGMRRVASGPETNRQKNISAPGEVARSFVRRARSSRNQGLIAILSFAWFAYNAVALVITLVRHQWAYSLVYAALTVVVPVLVYVRASAPKRPDTGARPSD